MGNLRRLPSDTELYVKVGRLRMSESERQLALHGLRDGEAIADAIIWASNALKRLGSIIALKPGVSSKRELSA